MAEPQFVDGKDSTTYAPFVLFDCRDTEWNDLRLEFSDHDWTQEHIGDEYVGECYLNGYGIQGLVIAARLAAGLEPLPEEIDTNSEAETCNIHFTDLGTAVETATLAQQMITDAKKRQQCAEIAVEEGFDDM